MLALWSDCRGSDLGLGQVFELFQSPNVLSNLTHRVAVTLDVGMGGDGAEAWLLLSPQ